MLAAPNSTDERLARLCAASEGFVYGVNLLGVTGERTSVAGSAGALAGRLKALTDLPVIMGFGISTPEQAVDVASASDGVIVASAIMRLLLDGGDIADAGRGGRPDPHRPRRRLTRDRPTGATGRPASS